MNRSAKVSTTVPTRKTTLVAVIDEAFVGGEIIAIIGLPKDMDNDALRVYLPNVGYDAECIILDSGVFMLNISPGTTGADGDILDAVAKHCPLYKWSETAPHLRGLPPRK